MTQAERMADIQKRKPLAKDDSEMVKILEEETELLREMLSPPPSEPDIQRDVYVQNEMPFDTNE